MYIKLNFTKEMLVGELPSDVVEFPEKKNEKYQFLDKVDSYYFYF